MMIVGCASCKEWQAHCYWEHMDLSKIRFFKLMIGDFAKGISLPEKFTRKFIGQITEVFDLKTLRGETWRVLLEKNGDDLFLASGWEEFVKAYELLENDLVMFTCSGSSSFDVRIFEANGCEKVSSLIGNGTGPNMKHSNNVPRPGKHAEHYSASHSEDTTTPSQLLGSPDKASASKELSENNKSCKQPEYPNSSNYPVKNGSIGEGDSSDGYANSQYYYSMLADRLGEEEKEEILSLASVGLNNPAFVTIQLKKHCQRRNNSLFIPRRFAADHLEERTHEVILRRPNRKEKWLIRYHYSSYRRCFQNLEFFKFVRDNKLREGDICFFELMKGAKRVTMTVYVIRKVDNRFVLVN